MVKNKHIESIESLFDKALAARTKAYAPVTGITFGVSLITRRGSVHVGANIEEWSLVLTRHAEMFAIDNMIFNVGNEEIIDVIVVVCDPKSLNQQDLIFPCGLCRNYISQFGTEETLIVAADLKGRKQISTLKDLLGRRPFDQMRQMKTKE